MPVARRSGSGGAIPTVVSVNGALAAPPKTATEFRAAAAQFAAQKQAERADFERTKAKFEANQLLLT